MSYNIDRAYYLSGKLRMDRAQAIALAQQAEWLPESSFLDRVPDGQGEFEIDDFQWAGSGSGSAYRDLLPTVLEKTTGSADILFVWEGGDSMTGLRVKDGTVSERPVKIVLG